MGEPVEKLSHHLYYIHLIPAYNQLYVDVLKRLRASKSTDTVHNMHAILG